MVSKQFRQQLRQELVKWRTENLISAAQAEELTSRYQLEQLDSSARNNFVMILIGCGSILLGLGIITLVAANWQFWSRELKVVFLMFLLIGINAGGFYLWNRRQNNWQGRLGKGLLLFGSLIFGANLGLMSQMFHQSGSVYQLFLIWSLGVVAMTYGLRLGMLAILGIILLAIAYLFGLFDNIFYFQDPGVFAIILQQLPLVASVLFIPLAYYCQSRWLFVLTILLVTLAFDINTLEILSDFSGPGAGLVAGIASIIPPGLCWAYRDNFWQQEARFQSLARRLAVFFISVRLYLFSFNYLWQNPADLPGRTLNIYEILMVLNLAIFALLMLWFWQNLLRENFDLSSQSLGGILLIIAVVIAIQFTLFPLGWLATVIFNALLFFLASGLVYQALASGNRLGFWWGMVLLVMQILTRVLEYNTGLLVKALVLFLCGLGVIIAGLWFERYLRNFNQIL